MGCVAQRRTGGKQTDAQVETECRCYQRNSIHRHALQLAPLEPTNGRVGQPDDVPDGSLTQTGGRSSSMHVLASPLTLPPTHAHSTQADAFVRSHVGIMGRGAYLAINAAAPLTIRGFLGPPPFQRAKDPVAKDGLSVKRAHPAFHTLPKDRSDVRWNAGGATWRTWRA